MDGENASRLLSLLDVRETMGGAVVVINCMPELMKRTRMGKLDFGRLAGISRKGAETQRKANAEGGREAAKQGDEAGKATSLLGSIGAWIGKKAKGKNKKARRRDHARSGLNYRPVVDAPTDCQQHAQTLRRSDSRH